MAETSGTDPAGQDRVAIVVGGGPAPGINGVIAAATIEAINNGHEVVGIMNGYEWLSRGDTGHVVPLTIESVSRIHLDGGSILRTARTNPTKSSEMMDNVVGSLRDLGIRCLVSIGGDDTCYTASRIDEATGDELRVAHVPKTIDNDLPLPGDMPTFGFETARHVGTGILEALMEDAHTTGKRWYFIVAMGRSAGHLALGTGKAAGATVIVIPEEFGDRQVTVQEIADILEGSMIKRRAMGRDFGVAVLAEGLATRISEEELARYGTVERDDHGHIRLSEIDLGKVIKKKVLKSLAERGFKLTIVKKELGYELRCADPLPFDAEYTRDLGYGAIKFLMQGGSGALISYEGGVMKPIPFGDLLDPETHRPRVRIVDIEGESYEVARKYMLRLEADDFADQDLLERCAQAGRLSPQDFRKRFEYLVSN